MRILQTMTCRKPLKIKISDSSRGRGVPLEGEERKHEQTRLEQAQGQWHGKTLHRPSTTSILRARRAFVLFFTLPPWPTPTRSSATHPRARRVQPRCSVAPSTSTTSRSPTCGSGPPSAAPSHGVASPPSPSTPPSPGTSSPSSPPPTSPAKTPSSTSPKTNPASPPPTSTTSKNPSSC